jgi:hypothetical protein
MMRVSLLQVACCDMIPPFPDFPTEWRATVEANIINQGYTYVQRETYSEAHVRHIAVVCISRGGWPPKNGAPLREREHCHSGLTLALRAAAAEHGAGGPALLRLGDHHGARLQRQEDDHHLPREHHLPAGRVPGADAPCGRTVFPRWAPSSATSQSAGRHITRHSFLVQERDFIPSMTNFVDDTASQVYSTKNFLMFEVRQSSL